MDPSQQQMHHRLARALMHLNQLAAFLPFFHRTPDWDSNPPPFSSHHGQASSRHLHTFVPLPTGSASSTSLASHGSIPSHYVLNPEPHLRAISYRPISHPESTLPTSLPSIPLRGPEGHHDDDMPAPTNPPPPRPKQACCAVPLHPDLCPLLTLRPFPTILIQTFGLPNAHELPPWLSLSTAMVSFQKNRLPLLHALRRSLILNLKRILPSSTITMWILTPRSPTIMLPKPHLRHQPIQFALALLHPFPVPLRTLILPLWIIAIVRGHLVTIGNLPSTKWIRSLVLRGRPSLRG